MYFFFAKALAWGSLPKYEPDYSKTSKGQIYNLCLDQDAYFRQFPRVCHKRFIAIYYLDTSYK